MRDFQQKRKLSKFIYSPKLILILVIIAVIVVRGAWGVYKKERESRANFKLAQSQYIEKEKMESELTAKIERLNTDSGIEEEIRQNFGVVKPGEEVVLIVEEKNKTTTEDGTKQSFWSKFKSGFLGIFGIE